MAKPNHDPSIENEPHYYVTKFEVDASEAKAERRLDVEKRRQTEHDVVEHSVWDEPTLRRDLAGEPDESQVTYERWLTKHIPKTSWIKSWFITFGVALLAGPFAIFGALFSAQGKGIESVAMLIVVAVIAPVTEEIMKIAAALWVVEKRPFWFQSLWQIFFCAIAGGILFGVIENLIYLHVYIPDAGPSLARWRWTVCVGLHMNCSFIAGVGLVRIWHNAIREKHQPIMGLGMPWFFTAMVGHGLYNFTVTVLEVGGWLELD